MLAEIYILALASMVGFKGQKAHTMVCIAIHESARNPKAVNNTLNKDLSTDIGLFQINNKIWGSTCKHLNLLDPNDNMICARLVYKEQGFTAWISYNKYKKKCDNYTVEH